MWAICNQKQVMKMEMHTWIHADVSSIGAHFITSFTSDDGKGLHDDPARVSSLGSTLGTVTSLTALSLLPQAQQCWDLEEHAALYQSAGKTHKETQSGFKIITDPTDAQGGEPKITSPPKNRAHQYMLFRIKHYLWKTIVKPVLCWLENGFSV